MRRINPNDFFLFFGSLATLIVSLFTAFVPGMAYVTVHSYFQNSQNPLFEPYVHYNLLNLQPHIFTTSYLFAAMGGSLGFFALFMKSKRAYFGTSGILVSILGLMYPPTNDNTMIIPEARLLNVVWIGGLVVSIGICLMFIGLVLKNERVPKASFLSLPLLITRYLFLPLLITSNYLPWAVFGAPTPSVIQFTEVLIPFVAILLMAWGTLKSKPSMV